MGGGDVPERPNVGRPAVALPADHLIPALSPYTHTHKAPVRLGALFHLHVCVQVQDGEGRAGKTAGG